MKIKIAILAVISFLAAPLASDARWGTEFTGSYWKMDGREFAKTRKTYMALATTGQSLAGRIYEGTLGGAASFFVEGNSRFRLGIATGYGAMPTVSTTINWSGTFTANADYENKIIYVPLDLYLKFTSERGKFNLFGGGGADYVIARTDFKADSGGIIKGSFTQKKMIPHVQAGCELFLAKWFSINIGAKYLFSAVLDNLNGEVTENGVDKGKNRLIMTKHPSGEYFDYTSAPLTSSERPLKYDLSGLRANVGLRIYFN